MYYEYEAIEERKMASFSSSRQPQHQQYRKHGNGNWQGNWQHNKGRNHFRPPEPIHNLDTDMQLMLDDAQECDKLYKELTEKMDNRFRKYAKLEAEITRKHNELKAEARLLAEEKKLVERWRQECIEREANTEQHLNEIRNEREGIERASTDFAVQLAELKRTQREMEKRIQREAEKQSQCENQTQSETEREKRLKAPGTEVQLPESPKDDDFDHVPLSKRIKLSKSEIRIKQQEKVLSNPEAINKQQQGVSNKKIVLQAALQEDAPGLFELLEAKGLTEDMDVVTNLWDSEAEGEGSEKDEFKDLADVIGKLWEPSTHFLPKDHRPKIQMSNSSKPNYCLSCLVSLIDQTKVLKQRKWPVKWGWCRPLNAFLFVFEKHNRIVVERPEYGFATYFFELVKSLPVKWQVDRLIKVMSCVCNCRAALLENRPLEVGKDLLPHEGAILENYGWTPNTGIGSLLNFYERVLHDYKSDDEAGEWKAKIGRMLLEGHDSGGIVTKVPNTSLCTSVKEENIDSFDSSGLQIVAHTRVKEEPNF